MSARRSVALAVAIALVLLTGGMAALVAFSPDAPRTPDRVLTAPDTPVVPPPSLVPFEVGDGPGTQRGAGSPEPALLDVQGASQARVPVSVAVPSLGIESDLDDLEAVQDGTLETPPRWQVAGWYAGGPRPGETGPSVIAGHVDSPSGPAVFTGLDRIAVGDEVVVGARGGGSTTFRVDRLDTAPRDGFPTEAVYGPTPDAQLRLITCDGPYDPAGGGYRDNLIVFATAVEA